MGRGSLWKLPETSQQKGRPQRYFTLRTALCIVFREAEQASSKACIPAHPYP